MPENRNLTTTQEEALRAYRELCEKNGTPPTLRELAEVLGKSRNACHALVNHLREKGFLSMKPVTIIRPKLTAKGRCAL